MNLYFAGPLFTTPERAWNADVVAGLRGAGHEVFLPQEKEVGLGTAGIFRADVAGIDAADALLAIVDGADADAGTSWEVGYAYASGKPILLVRTDIRAGEGLADPVNAMVAESASIRLDLPAASTADVVHAILGAVAAIERGAYG
jgi:nucleoside 2-deoxyribosyltransferase